MIVQKEHRVMQVKERKERKERMSLIPRTTTSLVNSSLIARFVAVDWKPWIWPHRRLSQACGFKRSQRFQASHHVTVTQTLYFSTFSIVKGALHARGQSLKGSKIQSCLCSCIDLSWLSDMFLLGHLREPAARLGEVVFLRTKWVIKPRGLGAEERAKWRKNHGISCSRGWTGGWRWGIDSPLVRAWRCRLGRKTICLKVQLVS